MGVCVCEAVNMCAVRGWCVPIIIHVQKRTFSIIQSSICVLFMRTPFSCTIKNHYTCSTRRYRSARNRQALIIIAFSNNFKATKTANC